MKRHIITLFLALAPVCSSWAQREVNIMGDVKDGFLKTPLTDVHVTICRADSSVLDTAKMTIYMRYDRPYLAVYCSLPHYVMVYLVYHWNKNPKKK